MHLAECWREFDLALHGVSAQNTREWYRCAIARLIAQLSPDIDVQAVTAGDLRRWRVSLLAEGLSVWTVHGYIRAVRRWFRWLVAEGIIDRSPAARVAPPTLPDPEPRGIAPHDVAAILHTARAMGARDFALVRFLADTGCRVGGLCGLLIRDLDVGAGRAVVHEKGGGGAGRARAVFYGPTTGDALTEWLGVRPGPPRGHVFLGRSGPLTRSGVYQLLQRLGKRAGVEGRCNPHSFRHAWARSALENGGEISMVSQILGHRSVEVTSRYYGRFSETELAGFHARYGHLREFEPARATVPANRT